MESDDPNTDRYRVLSRAASGNGSRKKKQVGGTRGGRKAAPPSSLISRFRPFALSRFPDNYAEVSNCRWNPMILTRIDIGFSRVRHGGTDREKRASRRNARRAEGCPSVLSDFALSPFRDSPTAMLKSPKTRSLRFERTHWRGKDRRTAAKTVDRGRFREPGKIRSCLLTKSPGSLSWQRRKNP
jgi:hypothetical protein